MVRVKSDMMTEEGVHLWRYPDSVEFRLAHQASVVLLNGGSFDGPKWSVRVSPANLDDLDYMTIGHHLHSIMEEYKEERLKTKK